MEERVVTDRRREIAKGALEPPNAGFACGALCYVSNQVAKRVQTSVAPNKKLNGCDAMMSSAPQPNAGCNLRFLTVSKPTHASTQRSISPKPTSVLA